MPSQGMNILFILYHNDWSKMTENIENQQKMIDIKKCMSVSSKLYTVIFIYFDWSNGTATG